MAVTLTNIETLVRLMIDDNLITVTDFFYYSTTNIFTLTESNSPSISAVYINNIETDGYSFDETTNRITISDTLSIDDIIEIRYEVYINYSSTEIQNYIQAILPFFSIFQYKFFKIVDNTFYPEPTEPEKYLIATIASIYINPENISISLPDFKVNVPQNKPTRQIIGEVINDFKFAGQGIIENLPKDIV